MRATLSITGCILCELLSDVLIVLEGHLKLLLTNGILLLKDALSLACLIMLIRGSRGGIGAHLAEVMPR